MLGKPKKVACIHDLSGFGRCSLSVILPTMSAMGSQACPIPTAVLSTHTGGFGDVVIRDLTDYTMPSYEHYKRLQIKFDCIYSGFLASANQIDHCREFFDGYNDALKVVDPVMGNHGKLYRTYTIEMKKRMCELVEIADIITPNVTEASMLLNEDYPVAPMTSTQAKSWLVRLAEIGPTIVVITGIVLAGVEKCNIGYDKNSGAFWRVRCDYVPVHYPGTGDIYASVLIGALLRGESLPIAMNRATGFIELAAKTTYGYGSEPREGLMIEPCLEWLTSNITMKDYTNL